MLNQTELARINKLGVGVLRQLDKAADFVLAAVPAFSTLDRSDVHQDLAALQVQTALFVTTARHPKGEGIH